MAIVTQAPVFAVAPAPWTVDSRPPETDRALELGAACSRHTAVDRMPGGDTALLQRLTALEVLRMHGFVAGDV